MPAAAPAISSVMETLPVLLRGDPGAGLERPEETGVIGKAALRAGVLGLDPLADQLLHDQDPPDDQVLMNGDPGSPPR